MARQMKDSGVEWIGEIPNTAKLIQLRFIANITTGNMDTQNREDSGEYPFYVRSPKVERSNHYSFDDIEAILMAGDGVGAGRVFHHVQGKYACHQRVYRMNNFKYVQPSFLKYYLESLFPMVMDQGSAKSTVDSVRLPMLQGFNIVVFSDEEQKKIADFLDEKVGEIDSVIVKTKETIEDYKKYKQAVITEAVTKGLHPDVEMKDSGIDWVGKIPKEWNCIRIKQLANEGLENAFADGDWIESPYIADEGIRYLTTGNIGDGIYKNQGNGYISLETFKTLNCKYAYAGDLVFSRLNAPYGRSCILPNDYDRYVIAVDNVILRPIDEAVRAYICFFTQCKGYQDSVSEYAKGTTMKRISRSNLGNICILMPPKKEQQQIVAFLDGKVGEINNLIKNKEELLVDLESYKKALIYEYVTGKRQLS